MMQLGQRIKDYMGDHDIRQNTVASALHIPETTLSGYLGDRRQMPYDILVELADYLNLSTDYLLGRTNTPSPALDLSPTEMAFVEDFLSLTLKQRDAIAQAAAKLQSSTE